MDAVAVIQSNTIFPNFSFEFQNIAEYAEFLAFHRKTNYSVVNGVNGSDYLDPNAFFFYNADNITNTTCDCDKEKDLEDEIREVIFCLC